MPRSAAPEPHSKDLRFNRSKDKAVTFFVTKSLFPKKPILNEEIREMVVGALSFACQEKRIYLRSFVIMPDHWHALFALRGDWTLPKFMHRMMSFVAGKTIEALRGSKTEWQEGYYDTRVKTAKQFAFIANYIEQNPVKKGIVEIPEDWKASSACRVDLVTEPWPYLYD